jgi:hypothetical protein
MNNLPFKVPSRIISALQSNAPSHSAGQRTNGYGTYRDDGNTYSGYNSVVLYIQNGLGAYKELIDEVLKAVQKVQQNVGKEYPLLPLGFGNSLTLQHEGKVIQMVPLNMITFNAISKITEIVLRISESHQSSPPAIIPELFPKVDIRSLYNGKTRIDENDLLIIIGKEGQVYFNEELETKLNYRIKKHMLFVEIRGEEVNYILKNPDLKYIKL